MKNISFRTLFVTLTLVTLAVMPIRSFAGIGQMIEEGTVGTAKQFLQGRSAIPSPGNTSPLDESVAKELIGGVTQAAQFAALTDGLSYLDPRAYIAQLLKIALLFVGLIFIARMVFAGVLWFTSEGNTEKTTKSKKILTQSSIGAAVLLLSFSIAQLVQFQIVKATQRNIMDSMTTCGSTAAVCCKEFAAYQNYSVSGETKTSGWTTAGCAVTGLAGVVTGGAATPTTCSNRANGERLLQEWKNCREQKGSWF